ncbi:hypothetical protein L0F63_005966 [Massospora cicadina]|nr:hypothetical protein L0F63_005966 [Massospora cicadina]
MSGRWRVYGTHPWCQPGGWLVLEPWITPSLFDPFKKQTDPMVVDEYTFCKFLGPKKATEQLEKHWNSWVTNEDFKALKRAGINYVRIPVGYWAFNKTSDEPWVDGSREQLVRGVNLAKENNIQGSGPRMLDVLDKVSTQFLTPEFKSTVTAIQLVNEPANWNLDMEKLEKFYDDGYDVIRKYSQEVKVTFHDAFKGLGYWEKLALKKGVFLDTHIYNVFDKCLIKLSPEGHRNHTCNFVDQLTKSKKLTPSFVGEWSLATTDCTLYLNGFMKGSRYVGNFENHNSPRLSSDYDFSSDECAKYDNVTKFSKDHKMNLKEFFDRQIGVYENAGSGWFFWNFKAENSPEWNFLLGVKEGWIRLSEKSVNTCPSK